MLLKAASTEGGECRESRANHQPKGESAPLRPSVSLAGFLSAVAVSPGMLISCVLMIHSSDKTGALYPIFFFLLNKWRSRKELAAVRFKKSPPGCRRGEQILSQLGRTR